MPVLILTKLPFVEKTEFYLLEMAPKKHLLAKVIPNLAKLMLMQS